MDHCAALKALGAIGNLPRQMVQSAGSFPHACPLEPGDPAQLDAARPALRRGLNCNDDRLLPGARGVGYDAGMETAQRTTLGAVHDGVDGANERLAAAIATSRLAKHLNSVLQQIWPVAQACSWRLLDYRDRW